MYSTHVWHNYCDVMTYPSPSFHESYVTVEKPALLPILQTAGIKLFELL